MIVIPKKKTSCTSPSIAPRINYSYSFSTVSTPVRVEHGKRYLNQISHASLSQAHALIPSSSLTEPTLPDALTIELSSGPAVTTAVALTTVSLLFAEFCSSPPAFPSTPLSFVYSARKWIPHFLYSPHHLTSHPLPKVRLRCLLRLGGRRKLSSLPPMASVALFLPPPPPLCEPPPRREQLQLTCTNFPQLSHVILDHLLFFWLQPSPPSP